MWNILTACLDSRHLCLVTRPLAGLVIAGVGGAVFGTLGGVVYGALHGSLDFVIAGGLRGVTAGAAAGLIAGFWSGLDVMTWPTVRQESSCIAEPKAPARLPLLALPQNLQCGTHRT